MSKLINSLVSVVVALSTGACAPTVPTTQNTTPKIIVSTTSSAVDANFSVSTSSATPTGVTFATGTAFNTVLKVDILSRTDADISEIGLRHFGTSPDGIIQGINVIDENGIRKSNYSNFIDGKVQIKMNTPIHVTAGKKTTVSMMLNFHSGEFTGTIGLGVENIVATKNDGIPLPIKGLPINSHEFFLISGSNVGNLIVDSQVMSAATIDLEQRSQNVKLGNFRFTQANALENMELHKITVHNNGNSADRDIKNLRLVDAAGSVLAKTELLGNDATFSLDTPYVFSKSKSATLSIIGDIAGGATRQIQFVIESEDSILVKGENSKGAILTQAGFIDSNFPIGDNFGINTFLIKEGSMSIEKALTSPSGVISAGRASSIIGIIKLSAIGEDIEIQGGTIKVTTPQPQNISKIRLVSSTGNTLLSLDTADKNMLNLTNGIGIAFPRFSNFLTVKEGKSEYVQIVADTATNAHAGDTINASVQNFIVKKLSSNRTSTIGLIETLSNTLTITK